MKGKVSWPLFWAMVAVFVISVCLFLIDLFGEIVGGSVLFMTPFAVFFLLAVAMLVFTLREKVAGLLKAFFLLTAASAIGVFVFILLHNAVYGLFIYFFGEGFWNGGDEPVFFILALIVCPLGFLTGAIGSIVLRIREARSP
jgi:DMSO/TMAO reductase YedYZ heme-binding membrane subunit